MILIYAFICQSLIVTRNWLRTCANCSDISVDVCHPKYKQGWEKTTFKKRSVNYASFTYLLILFI